VRFELALRGPTGEPVDLWRTLVSHGFAELPPMRLDPATRSLALTLRVPGAAPRRVRIGPGRPGRALVEVLGPGRAGPRVRPAIEEGARRVLGLDQDLSGFYATAATDPDLAWATAGAGRMLASPTVFEDVVKTICTTNCSWSLTTTMVSALVAALGEPPAGSLDRLENAFPTPAAMAARPEAFYRTVVRAGYRAPYLRAVARAVADGAVDLEAWAAASREELPDEELERRLLALPGVGPYAAAHILLTLGRGSRLVLDSWTRPTYARLTGQRRPPSDAAIERRFRRYGDRAGLAFWLVCTRDWVQDP
jgi:N-glycosylase/DNA lyase